MDDHTGSGSDASKMQVAFQQFMLQSKNNHQSSEASGKISTISDEERLKMEQQKQHQQEINQIQSELKKGEKQYWSIFHRFCNLLFNQWVHIDDQSLLVIESISGIRERLPIQTKLLQKYKDAAIMSSKNDEWKHHAYNQQLTSSSNSALLSMEDTELAFTHDLEQHEKMMECLRSLFANLSEMHESMSRTLDEMMKHQLNQEEQVISTQEYYKHYPKLFKSLASYKCTSSLVHLMTELFHMLSLELYRKQSFVQYVLNSADDRILSPQDGQVSISESGREWFRSGPKEVVDHCLKYWPRSCKQSCIDAAVYDLALKKHEGISNSNLE